MECERVVTPIEFEKVVTPAPVVARSTTATAADVQPCSSKDPNTSTVPWEQMTEEKLMSNPVLQKMMEKFFQEKFKKAQESKGGKSDGNKVRNITSPSDTTIYAPALQRKLTPQNQIGEVIRQFETIQTQQNEMECNMYPNQNLLQQNVNVHDQINDFVDNICKENHLMDTDNVHRRSHTATLNLDEARDRASRKIIEAEKFTTVVEQPGMIGNLEQGDNTQVTLQIDWAQGIPLIRRVYCSNCMVVIDQTYNLVE